MERKSIGTFIAALRRSNGMTQKELAEKLNVSDKAVSRWERDESLPDLMLLPVIADIFHVTADELLRGERKSEQPFANEDKPPKDTEAEAARLKKQTKRVLQLGISRLRMKYCIALCMGMVGLLGALICNFAFSKGFAGFLIGFICVMAAAVTTVLFAQNAWQAADDEELEESAVRTYRVSVVRGAKATGAALTAMLSMILPLAVSVGGNLNGYQDVFIAADSWLICSVICLSTLETALSYAFYKINSKMLSAGYPCNKKNAALHGWIVRILCVLMALTLLGLLLVPDAAYLARSRGDVFDSVEAFVAEMENRWAYQQEHGYTDDADMTISFLNASYYDENGSEISAEEAALHDIYDREGNVIAQYHRPYEIAGVTQTYYSDDEISIRCYTRADVRQAAQERETKQQIIWCLYTIEPAAALMIWCALRKAKEK